MEALMEDDDKAHMMMTYTGDGGGALHSESDIMSQVPFISKARGKRPRLNDTEECRGVRGPAWKDSWVYHLIHIRGEMNEEFSTPPRQGVDLWGNVCGKLERKCSDFDKSQESCRKKWRHIYKEYREDRAAQKGAGDDVEVTKRCKWYYLIDEYMHDRAHIPEAPLELLDPVAEEDNVDSTTPKGGAKEPNLGKARPKPKEEDLIATITSRVDKIVENSTQLLEKFDKYEKEKVVLLGNLNETLKGFMCILKESS